MRIEQSYPTPVHGVSTLAPRNRPQGYMSSQVNFRSDPVNKLTRRPSSLYKHEITTVSDTTKVKYHSYERDGQEFGYIVDKVTGNITCLIDDHDLATLNIGNYVGDDIGLFTIEHDTYILNRDKVVETLTDTDEGTIEKVSHINITSALNYSETIQINVTKSDGSRGSVSFTVPDLGVTEPNYDAADRARATKNVALELALLINSGGVVSNPIPNPYYDPETANEFVYGTIPIYISEDPTAYVSREENPLYDPATTEPYLDTTLGIEGIEAKALGSTVAIWETGKANWVQVEVEAGQGDRTAVAINKIIEDTDGLPLYAKVGTRITVRPDPTSEKGIYYLQAERISDNPSGFDLEEVVWSETRHPTEEHSLDNTTMPHKLVYKDGVFTFEEVDFRSRKTGDQNSTPFPDFVGSTIQSMGYFQKRLVVVADNSVFMTETDDLLNWFKQSAVQLLVSDTIDVSTSELGVDRILHLVPHNKDLMCIASNSQFKIPGDTAITPETVSMPLTTKYECQISVPPVAIGNSVYFPIDYGDSTGVQEYTGEKDTNQDFAAPITNHIIGYLKGKAKLFAASPNLEMLVMTTTESKSNELYVYEQYTDSSGARKQKSWSTWEFPEGQDIIDVKFRRNELVLIVAKNGRVIVKTVPMYTRVTGSPIEIHLDDLIVAETDGEYIVVPTQYDHLNAIAVRGSGVENELWRVNFTRTKNRLYFDEPIGSGTVYLGVPFTSSVEPTRPFKYDEDGSTITTDRIRVSRWILSLVDTYELSMTRKSKYYKDNTTTFESRVVGSYPLGEIHPYTGDWKFSYGEEAALATATFFTSSYLSCTIADISWEGQYYKSKQRM